MSKLDSKPKHQANIPLTSHDLSHQLSYTSSTGMLLPVCCDLLNPGEKISINVDVSDTRTMPVASAAFANIDIHVDYFFVPMTLLYSPFESFIYQIDDYFSSAIGVIADNDFRGLPLMSTDGLLTYINTNKTSSPNSSYGWTSTYFDCLGCSAFRLLDMLGMNPFFDSSSMTEPVSGEVVDFKPSIFPWQLLSYNAIFQYYFRLDDYEKFDCRSFNVDGSHASTITDFSKFYLHYRPQYMDYFTSVKNSPLVTVTNLTQQPSALPLAKSWLSRSDANTSVPVLINGRIGSRGTDTDNVVLNSPLVPSSTPTVNTNFGFSAARVAALSSGGGSVLNGADINTANLRAIFANEKLWSITGATRKTYDAQTLAHFGFDVPHDVLHQVTHIGHDVTPVRIGEVISTAGTDNQPLGTVAGKGYAANVRGSEHKFTAPCHGVLMALTSAMVKTPYIAGFDKINAVANWQDFYQPEFDHLGMQPLFKYEVGLNSAVSSNIVGWQYRYEQYKRKYDRCTRAFGRGYFNTWSPVMAPFNNNIDSSDLVNTAIPTDYAGYFYQSPMMLNNIMVVPYTVSWSADYLTNPEQIYENDPLVTHAFINYHKLSTMSAYSMPRLDA